MFDLIVPTNIAGSCSTKAKLEFRLTEMLPDKQFISERREYKNELFPDPTLPKTPINSPFFRVRFIFVS